MIKQYDFAIVGAGIAGIAIAELLQRSGNKVLLLEANNTLASQASSQNQGWFHTGALYAAFPSNTFFKLLVKNIANLLKYYSGFPNMNLRYGRPFRVVGFEGWFESSRTYYFYVNPAESEIPLLMKPLWFLATALAKSRLSYFENIDFSRNIDSQMLGFLADSHLSRSQSSREFNFHFEKKMTALLSHDLPLNSKLIINDLIKSYLHFGGLIKLESRAVLIKNNTLVVIEKNTYETIYRAKHIVVTAGSHSGELISLGKKKIRVIKSPLLVVAPALSDINFVRLSTNASRIVNHFYHHIKEGGYSVIGNADYFKSDEILDVDLVKSRIIDRVTNFFGYEIDPSNSSLYFGYKTELPGISHLRNYRYHLLESINCTLALPGKLSFAFSLAVDCCRYFGIDPPVTIPVLNCENPLPISDPMHAIVASQLFQNICGVPCD